MLAIVIGEKTNSRMNGRALTYNVVKRAFDICFSSVTIVMLCVPSVLLGIAISIESSGGPIFKQKRIGKDEKEFFIYKFRSMYSDADEAPSEYLDDNQMTQWTREKKVDNDPRVTRIGKLIRKTSLDELPQLINVFIGEMSLIGPRPVTLEETYEFAENRREVLSVRPGITGWWQVKDRNNATWENGRRQELELEYVRNASLEMDAKIFFNTFTAMFGKHKSGR